MISRIEVENKLHTEIVIATGLAGESVVIGHQNSRKASCPYITMKKILEVAGNETTSVFSELTDPLQPQGTLTTVSARNIMQVWRIVAHSKQTSGSLESADYLDRLQLHFTRQDTCDRLRSPLPSVAVPYFDNIVDITDIYGVDFESVSSLDIHVHVISTSSETRNSILHAVTTISQ
jgi:hypothetical protein